MIDRRTISVTVHDADDDGARADVVLGRRVPGLSRRVARAMALEGRLRLDGRRTAPSTRVRAGQRLELSWPATMAPESLRILRVTDAFVYVDKAAGVHTHRLRPSDPPALADAVVAQHPECASASPQSRELGAVHRLDGTTSGVVAFARTPRAWTAARAGLSSGRVEKLYFAICRWQPDTSVVDLEEHGQAFPGSALPVRLRPSCEPGAVRIAAPIGRGDARGRVRVRADGLEALTIVWRLAPQDEPDIVPCLLRLCTGRRHQARVHLAHIGLPILGDAVYGSPEGALRPLLHALRLDLSTCFPDEAPVEAPIPPDIGAWVGLLTP
jgi:23S rRNA pseudouridine1911/1915/1917 synthase